VNKRPMADNQDERGVIAIFLAVVIGLLLLTTTVYAARLSVDELSQSSQIDQGESAYYAAEAGVEDALRRLQENPHGKLCVIFPQQYPNGCNQAQTGDMLALIGSDGTNFPHSNTTDATVPTTTGLATDDGTISVLGQLAWRDRQVFLSSTVFTGIQVKDQTLQFDFSDLCRQVGTTVYGTTNECGGPTNGKDYNGNPIMQSFEGAEYCWTSSKGSPEIEVTDVSWPTDAAGDVTGAIATEKTVVNSGTGGVNLTYGKITVIGGAAAAPYNSCLQFDVNANSGSNTGRRYIFRLKVVDPTTHGATDSNGTQDSYGVQYQAQIMENAGTEPAGDPLYVPKGSYLIDVVGQSGSIARRIVAKEFLGNGANSIFDYVIFSGSTTTSLCKPGVQQSDTGYNIGPCAAIPAVN
jgi:hypothetical protein